MICMKELISVKERHERYLLGKRNVTGVGIGFKKAKGKKTNELSIVVLVEKKLPETVLKDEDIIEKELEGVPTDVQEVGRIKALIQEENPRIKKWRPAPGGVSIGHHDITAGTLGVTVKDAKTGELLLLSNNHVLANSNEGDIGDSIFQPGPYDGGREEDKIAELHRFVPINFQVDPGSCPFASGTARTINELFQTVGSHHRLVPVRLSGKVNTVDAAVALPVSNDLVRGGILDIGVLRGTKEAELDMVVEKCGRTTGRTEGTVDVMDTTVNVMYGLGQLATFSHQLVLSALSQGGDSGSVVVSENKAVGLLFAGSEDVTICNPITLVMGALHIEI